VLGEVDLTGKIRPVSHAQERLKEASKMGFKYAIIPEGNLPKTKIEGLKCIPVKNVMGALSAIKEL
jgi:DNA repair protein RadA/Sms